MSEKKPHLPLLEESFPGITANIMRCETLGFPWASIPFLKQDKSGESVSHVGFIEYPMVVAGRQYKAGALHAICTKETHRNQGLASELIHEALVWAKERYEFVVLFTEIPEFYERLSFCRIQEYRFHLACKHPQGSRQVLPLTSPHDNDLFIRCFRERAAVSNHLWIKDNGAIASFNTLFATYPTYWSLYYCPSIDGVLSFQVRDKTLHLFDVVASSIPSLEVILDHIPSPIEEIYFYFSPDLRIDAANLEPLVCDNTISDFSGYLMVHGNWPAVKQFMISPLSRC